MIDTSSARAEILTRIRAAWQRSASDAVPEPVDRLPHRPTEPGELIDLFDERVSDYKATVWRIDAAELGDKIAEALQTHEVSSVVAPAGLGDDWVSAAAAAGIQVRRDDPVLSHAELNTTGAVLTAARVGIAETGTIVLDHDDTQGRRALSLVPDVHICVIRADQVVADVPEAVAALHESAVSGRPMTWISGGSATSDIELSRVEGVHGPRTLHVLLVG